MLPSFASLTDTPLTLPKVGLAVPPYSTYPVVCWVVVMLVGYVSNTIIPTKGLAYIYYPNNGRVYEVDRVHM